MTVVGHATIDVNINGRGTLRAVTAIANNVAKGLGGTQGAINRFTLGFVKMGAAVGAVGIAVAELTPAIGGALGAIGQMSGVIAALPAFGLAGAAAISALVIGMRGFMTAGGEAGKLRQVFEGFSTQWQDLKSAVQGNLFAGLAKPFQDLGNNYIPVLKTGLSGIAAGFNTMTKTAIGFLNTQQSLNDTATGLGNTKKMFDNLNASVVPAWQAVRDLAVEGSTFLPGFGDAVANVSQKFADFIAEARASGQIQAWIENGVEAFKTLGRILANIHDAFQSIFEAAGASGFGFLNTLEQVTEAFATLMGRADVKEGLAAVFQAGQAAMTMFLGALSANLGPLLGTFGPALAQLMTALGKVASVAVSILAPALSSMMPALGSLAQSLGNTLVKTMAAAKPGIDALAAGFNALAPIWGNTLGRILPLMGQMFSAVMPIIMQLAQNVLPPLWGALEKLIPPIMQLIMAILPPFITFIESLIPIILEVVDAFIPLIELLAEVLPPILDALGAVFTVIFGVIGEIVKGAIAYIIQSIENLIAFWELLKASALAVWELIKSYIITPIMAVWDFIKGFIDGVLSFFGKMWDAIPAGVQKAFALVKSYIIDPLKAAYDWVVNVFSGIGKIFNDVWQGMVDFMKSIFSGIGQIVSDAFSGVVDFLKGIINGIIGFFNSTIIWGINKLIDGANLLISWIPGVDAIPNLKEVPKLATGGVVSSPTLAMIGEGRHPERIEPLDPAGLSARDHAWIEQMTGGAGGGNTVVIVKIGERELTEIVDYRVERNNEALARGAFASGRATYS